MNAWLICLLSLFIGSCVGCGGSSEKWEYYIIGDIKNELGQTVGTSADAVNKAGQEGWEAVGVFPNAAVLMKRKAGSAPVVVAQEPSPTVQR